MRAGETQLPEGANARMAPGHIVGGPPTRVIRPTAGWAPLDLAQLWRYRELAFFMAWRDIRLRYRQTLLGVGWAILQPLTTGLVFTVFFGLLAGIPSDGSPYPVFALAGLIPWQLFSNTMVVASSSLVNNRHMLSKVYFPRIIVPFSSVGAGLLDFMVSFGVLMAAMAWYHVELGARVAVIPLLVIFTLVAAFAVGLWLATLSGPYRDIQYTIPFLNQLWLFATPVVYPASLVPEPWRPWLGLNPMSGVVEGFRWALLGTGQINSGLLWISSGVSVLALVTGLYYFRRTERNFADVI